MSEFWLMLKISLVVWLLFIFFIYFIVNEKFRSLIRIILYYFSYYSGIYFIFRKFIPSQKKILPTGVIWIVGIYFAAYAFTDQRYENQLNQVELRYTIFTSQVAAGTKFSNQTLMKILNTNLPVKPYVSISKFWTLPQSFLYSRYPAPFFLSYGYSSAAEFRADVINQWKNKLEGADFSGATKLESADFKFANLKRANFGNIILAKADFGDSNLEMTNSILQSS